MVSDISARPNYISQNLVAFRMLWFRAKALTDKELTRILPLRISIKVMKWVLFNNKDRLPMNDDSYRKTSNISRTLVGNKIVDNSHVIGASPVGAAPTTSSFST